MIQWWWRLQGRRQESSIAGSEVLQWGENGIVPEQKIGKNGLVPKNIARGTTDPGIASINWIIFPASYKAGKFSSKENSS